MLVALFFVCRFLAARTPRPAVLWSGAAYLGLLHLICLYGLLTSTRFDTALAHLTLLTFPFSMSLEDTAYPQGFSTMAGLASNYVRYVVCFGSLNALLLAGFLSIVVRSRSEPR